MEVLENSSGNFDGMARGSVEDPEDCLLVYVHYSCRGSNAGTLCQGTRNSLEELFFKVGVIKSRFGSWSRSSTRGTKHEGLFRVDKQTGNTVSLKCKMNFLDKAEPVIGHSAPGLFINALETVAGLKKFMVVRMFVRVHGQDEEVWPPLFPSANFSMILSTVRREHST